MDRFPERIDSKFRFVLLAANRAEQMMRGSRPKVEEDEGKLTRMALREIQGDMITWDYGPAAIEEELEEVAVSSEVALEAE